MSKLLRQQHSPFQKSSPVNDGQGVRDTQSSEIQHRQKCDHRSLDIYKCSISLVSATLLFIALYANSTRLLSISREIQCGRVTSTIRISSQVEMHTEIDKSCADNSSGSDSGRKGD